MTTHQMLEGIDQMAQSGKSNSNSKSPSRQQQKQQRLMEIAEDRTMREESPTLFSRWSLQVPGVASFWLIASIARVEWAMAPPARISAATQIASMISCSVAPFSFACLVWLRMQ